MNTAAQTVILLGFIGILVSIVIGFLVAKALKKNLQDVLDEVEGQESINESKLPDFNPTPEPPMPTPNKYREEFEQLIIWLELPENKNYRRGEVARRLVEAWERIQKDE